MELKLISNGKAFSGWADIREFNKPEIYAEPNLLQVIDLIEMADKPVVAAIHSVAMGGGLELAPGCNYRVTVPGAQITFPEIKPGILPGGGVTSSIRKCSIRKRVTFVVNRADSGRKPAPFLKKLAAEGKTFN